MLDETIENNVTRPLAWSSCWFPPNHMLCFWSSCTSQTANIVVDCSRMHPFVVAKSRMSRNCFFFHLPATSNRQSFELFVLSSRNHVFREEGPINVLVTFYRQNIELRCRLPTVNIELCIRLPERNRVRVPQNRFHPHFGQHFAHHSSRRIETTRPECLRSAQCPATNIFGLIFMYIPSHMAYHS